MTRPILILAAALLLTACGDSGSTGTKVGTTTPTGATSSTATAKPAPSPTLGQSTFKPGDQVKVGDLILVVNTITTSPGTQYEKPKSGQYLLVAVAITNAGTTPVRLSSFLNFEVRDDTGQTYTITFLSNTPAAPEGTIAPGDKLAGTLVYDTPPGKTFRLYFKSAILAGKQAIVDLGAH